MILDANSLERLMPDEIQHGDTTGQETLDLHLARYRFAAKHLRPGRLLDIACGTGYGTRWLSDCSEGSVTALGVDISEAAILYARKRYGNERVRFEVADATRFLDQDGFDTIVSLETIEHLPNPEAFIARLVRQLRPSGIFIGSVPITPSVDANPYHLHDFTERSFRKMVLCHGLREVSSFQQVQPYKIVPILTRKEARARDVRTNLLSYYFLHPEKLALRIWSTLRHGFNNHYVTICWQTND
jgi:2-polyprenyl-3-methyl-5-hydroxy-6-metoxy-1,4-benzoquinol methylase